METGSLGSPSTKVTNFTYFYIERYELIVKYRKGARKVRYNIMRQPSFWSFAEPTDTTLSYLPTHPIGQDMTQGQFLSGV